MKTLYLDCSMGAAGDMLTGALLELLEDREAFLNKLNHLGIPGVVYKSEKSVKCGITGTHITVSVNGEVEGEHHHHHHHDHEHHHHHSGMHDIEHIVSHLAVSEKVRHDILAVYHLIAQAESEVHNMPMTDIHFHEVGTMDAIADVTAVSLLMDEIRPDQVVVSPIHVGSGQVKCAHGILPVPAPATAKILKGIPIYGGAVKGELCTPTGAALLKHFATAFGDMPLMSVSAIGYGMGYKDFEAANCVRAMLGETKDETDSIYELNCNVDDMTGEEIGFAMDRLFEAGAVEVFTSPIGMKKNRPGIWLHVLCRKEKRGDVVKAIFRYTSTIGIRETSYNRYVLKREMQTIHTEKGDVRRKISTGYGVTRVKHEYDDLMKIAEKENKTLSEIIEEVKTQE